MDSRPPVPAPESPPAAAGEVIPGADLLAWRRRRLGEGGRACDLDWLLDLAGGVAWQHLQAVHLHPERPVALQRDRRALEALWHRHLERHEPLQYLLGRCPWRDLELLVGPGVLIPRQESELLVDLAVDLLASARPPAPAPLWADLGTGSGCLAVALGRAFPGSRGFAVESSPRAAPVAVGNLARAGLGERVTVLPGSWWEPLRPWWGQIALAVSNPPYVPSSVVEGLEPVVRDHEPREALDGGPDGLDAIRVIAAGAPEALAPGGLLVLEHHHDQSDRVQALLRQAGLVEGMAHRDLEGVLRFASARRPVVPAAS
jgi:release factor glutamine methyltransferase